MVIIRPIVKEDIDAVYELTQHAKAGLTTLPHDRALLLERIESSVNTFLIKPKKPKGDTYLFVAEDLISNEIIGICGIVSKVGGFEPFYTYEIKTALKQSKELNVNKEIQYLDLVRIHNGPTEIGSLFLKPDTRHKGMGRLLSLSRFLFMAQYPNGFEKEIVAELRGVFDGHEHSPFWDAVGQHFFNVEFKKADLRVMKDKSFIEELMPQHPIYIPLLPKDVQAVIGQVDEKTKPARHILESEGFHQINQVDIFEAGPVYKALTKEVRTISNSRTAKVSSIEAQVNEKFEYLIAKANEMERFRACIGGLKINDDHSVTINESVAEALMAKVDDQLRYVTLK